MNKIWNNFINGIAGLMVFLFVIALIYIVILSIVLKAWFFLLIILLIIIIGCRRG